MGLRFPVRWRFPTSSESARRGEIQRAIDNWWQAFTNEAPAIASLFEGGPKWDLAGFMSQHLQAIADLAWEFGPGLTGDHRLVITAESDRFLRPLVTQVLRSAPKLEGWDFLGYRPPESVAFAQSTVKGRTGFDATNLTAVATRGAFGTVDLKFFSAAGEDIGHPSFVAAESLVGELLLDRWVGDIEHARGAGDPLAELKASVDSLIAQHRATLQGTPWWRRAKDTSWSIFELKPEAADDWAAQGDLLIGKAADVEFFRNTRSGRLFSSERFSRCGETFAYLKTDGAEGLPPDGFADKAEIEDALDAALMPLELGCHIGGGTGLRYSYVDLALTDVDRALPVITRAMQRGRLPKRSWLLFFDSDLQWEWVGIWPDSPPPPLDPIGD